MENLDCVSGRGDWRALPGSATPGGAAPAGRRSPCATERDQPARSMDRCQHGAARNNDNRQRQSSLRQARAGRPPDPYSLAHGLQGLAESRRCADEVSLCIWTRDACALNGTLPLRVQTMPQHGLHGARDRTARQLPGSAQDISNHISRLFRRQLGPRRAAGANTRGQYWSDRACSICLARNGSTRPDLKGNGRKAKISRCVPRNIESFAGNYIDVASQTKQL